MEDKIKIIIPVILILALFGTLLVLFSDIHSDEQLRVTQSYAVTNASAGDVYVAGARLKNATVTVIRTTPGITFRCTRVNWGYSAGINNGSNGIKQLTVANGPAEFSSGVTEALCTGNGTIKLFLAGNTSNGSIEGRGKHYNVSFSADRWTHAFNASNAQQTALSGAGSNLSSYYSLLILAVILAVVLVFLGIKFGMGGFGGSGGGGGGFDLSSVFDKFER